MMSGRAGEAGRGGGGGRGGQQGRGGRGGGGRGKKQQVKRPPKHVSKIKLEKSNKAIIEYIRREGTKENILIANALETGVAPTIPVPAFPPQVPDPANSGQMIDDQGVVSG
jgi:hypothetical protein